MNEKILRKHNTDEREKEREIMLIVTRYNTRGLRRNSEKKNNYGVKRENEESPKFSGDEIERKQIRKTQ